MTALSNGSLRHFNRYTYAYNNPYRFTDPDGRCPVCIIPFVVGLLTYSEPANAPAPGEMPIENSSADALAAAIPPAKFVGQLRYVINASDSPAPVLGKPQVTRKDGKETTHASTSQRLGDEQSQRPDVERVHLNQTVITITGGKVKSEVRPDVGVVRTDGKVDVDEVLSPGPDAAASVQKYTRALGDSAGKVQCVPPDKC